MRSLAMAGSGLLLGLLAGCLAAAQVSVQALPLGSMELNSGWRTHAGDNLAWAQPDFDDSHWSAATLGEQTPLPAGWTWYRLTLHAPPQSKEPLALLVTVPGGSCETYVNGQRASAETIGSWLHMTAARAQVVALPHDGVFHVALRVNYPKSLAGSYGSFLNVQFGGISGIQAEAASTVDDRVINFLPAAFAAHSGYGLHSVSGENTSGWGPKCRRVFTNPVHLAIKRATRSLGSGMARGCGTKQRRRLPVRVDLGTLIRFRVPIRMGELKSP